MPEVIFRAQKSFYSKFTSYKNVFPYCRKCKGHRMLCGLNYCPIIKGLKTNLKNVEITPGDLNSITPPGVFIGEYNYPKVYAGPMMVHDPSYSFPTGNQYGKGVSEIVALNNNLYRASSVVDIKDVAGKYSLSVQESAMSTKTLDVELSVVRKISGNSRDNNFFDTPVGPMYEVSKVDITDNPKIPSRVDIIYNDNHLGSREALETLYRNGFTVNYLQGVLSSGALGIQKNRRIVPTRWSITAVDDTLSGFLKEKILDYSIISDIMVFTHSYNGNYFDIILLPYSLSYEMQEVWQKGSIWSSGTDHVNVDYEFLEGRKTYASEITGAYYAARLAVYEYLDKIRRQAAIIVLRRVSGEYYSPLGVWVIREAVRNAMNTPPVVYRTIDEMIREHRMQIPNWREKSKILGKLFVQKTISDYF